MTTETAVVLGSTLTLESERLPWTQLTSTSKRSQSSSGTMACVSGSPKRQLNSMTTGPSAVSINPAKRQPTNGLPSALSPSTVGCSTSFVILSSMAASTTGVGAKAPMPPVLGPWSPSKARLWSCAGGNTATCEPSVSASTEHSVPSKRCSSTISWPAAPIVPRSRKSRTATLASTLSLGTITPFPAASPLALTTTSNLAEST
mmetsp:Transcript_85350/g.238224  ORF Transcript_85350/g.238224 Transcript_85350/m.238224 type:complete len:203 (-) Transcript_85350:2531-3139(-)